MRVSSLHPEKHAEARNLTLKSASRPSARPLSLAGLLEDLPEWLQHCALRSCHNDSRAGRRRAISTARPARRDLSVKCVRLRTQSKILTSSDKSRSRSWPMQEEQTPILASGAGKLPGCTMKTPHELPRKARRSTQPSWKRGHQPPGDKTKAVVRSMR